MRTAQEIASEKNKALNDTRHEARLGAKLRAMREAYGLSLAEVAEEVGLTTGTISKYERGLTFPSIITVGRFCRFYGVTLDAVAGHYVEEDWR